MSAVDAALPPSCAGRADVCVVELMIRVELKRYKFGKKMKMNAGNETQSGRQVYTQYPRITSYCIAASSLVHTVGVGSKNTVLGMPAVQSKATGAILSTPLLPPPLLLLHLLLLPLLLLPFYGATLKETY